MFAEGVVKVGEYLKDNKQAIVFENDDLLAKEEMKGEDFEFVEYSDTYLQISVYPNDKDKE